MQDIKINFLIGLTCLSILSCNDKANSAPATVGVEDSLMKYKDTSGYKTTSLNTHFPAIKGVNHIGDSIDFQKMNANYVLLEFWASWCPPCRKANPELVAVYHEFKDKGFDIFSVSLDDKKSKWQDAIYKDKLVWKHHMTDYMGWESPLARTYNIESIPNNILFDKNGNQIAKELSPEQLREILAKLQP